MALTERPKITFSPNEPMILDQNAVSHPTTPFFSFFPPSPMPLNAKTGALTYIDLINVNGVYNANRSNSCHKDENHKASELVPCS